MKITMLILFAALMQVSAASFSQKITLTERNIPLEKVLESIKRQSGYMFFYNKEDLKQSKNVNINLKDASIKDALDQCLTGQFFSYKIIENTIVIKKIEPDLIDKITGFFRQDSVVFKGRVLDAFGQPLSGATVKVKGNKKSTFTTTEGNFVIYADANATLQISYLGYETQELKLRREDAGILIKFNMKQATQDLSEVVVSTGYQNLPKERATGSFEIISAKQLEHSNNPNLLKRLEGITASMDFNNPVNGNANLSSGSRRSPIVSLTIRGKNTLEPPGFGLDKSTASGQILVVIDGIPSAYSIDQINPEDVESINVLKDAAAASIWGSRAANGVIVIKTKKGSYNKRATVSFNTNVNISDKIDLFYKKFMSTSDFIDAQIQKYYYKYHTGPVDNPINLYAPQAYLSPVEEIVNSKELGELTPDQAKARLDALRGNDVRRDLDQYFLRKTIVQNYTLSIDGGTEKYAYRLSGGFSGTEDNTTPSSSKRYNLNYSAMVRPVKNLSLQGIVTYNESHNKDQNNRDRIVGGGVNTGFNPYSKLVDEQGNPLAIPYGYRPKYLKLIADRFGDKILDMSFKPLDNINQGYYKVLNRDLNLNLSADYRISSVFSANVTYGYTYGQDEETSLNGVNSYYTRNLINIWTTREDYIDPFSGFIKQPLKKLIPVGGIYEPDLTKRNKQLLRALLSADKTWNGKHQLSAIAFFDADQFYSLKRNQQFYGYNEKTLTYNNKVPFGIEFNRLISDPENGLGSGMIDAFLDPGDLVSIKARSLSLASNAAYTYDRRYTLSASVRKQMNSAAGAANNKSGAPYISIGGLWNMANEKFYKLDWLPILQLKATFGYNGNVNVLRPPRPTLTNPPTPESGSSTLPYGDLRYVTNSKLRPEKSATLNLGLNFGAKNNRLSGSVDYFVRNTTDMLTEGPLDPTFGIASEIYNAANIRSRGVDAILNSINLRSRDFSWSSNLTFSYNRVKILKLLSTGVSTTKQLMGFDKVEGYELNRIAGYRWGGLDPQTGDPMGYDINGNKLRVSSSNFDNVNKIMNQPASSARYFGSAVPVYFGAFRNTFTYKDFSVTLGLQYKLGYYFRRGNSDVMRYNQLFEANTLGPAEYAHRWQKPGDELITNVPSLTFPTSPERDEFYQFSEINVLKADHIRFQEINLSYIFRKSNWFIKNPRIYGNVNNLGILWRANKAGLDPDINDYPAPRTYSIGLSANF